jgi:hypothetical protein
MKLITKLSSLCVLGVLGVTQNIFSQPSLLWEKTFGGTGNETVTCMTTDVSGNTYAAGFFTGTVDFNHSTASSDTAFLTATGTVNDMFLSKTDVNGNFLWVKKISSTVEIQPKVLKVDKWNNIVYCGYFKGTVDFDPDSGSVNVTSYGGYDAFLARLKPNGTYDNTNGYAQKFGGTGDDYGTAMDLANSNQNIYLAGTFTGVGNFGNSYQDTAQGQRDIFILKLSGNGGNVVFPGFIAGNNQITIEDLVFQKVPGGSNSITTPNFTITGKFNTQLDFDIDPAIPGNGPDTVHRILNSGVGGLQTHNYLAMYSINMGYLYAKDLGSLSKKSALAVDKYGNTYVAGAFTGTHDFDPSASTLNLVSNGGNDAFIAKYNKTTGSISWAKSIGGTQDDFALNVAINETDTNDRSVYVAGTFNSAQVDFNTDTAVTELYSAVGYDGFISKLDNTGYFKYASTISGAGDENISHIGHYLNNLILGGEFSSANTDFDLTSNTLSGSSNGSSDIFITSNAQCDMIDKFIDVQAIYLQSNFYNNSPYGASAQYQWLDCGNNYSVIAGETNYYIQFSNLAIGNLGPYAVQITYNGCVDTSYCENLLSVGIDTPVAAHDLFSVYPNPANEQVQINASEPCLLIIQDITGKTIYARKISSTTEIINTTTLAQGTYVLRFVGNEKTSNKKLIINR